MEGSAIAPILDVNNMICCLYFGAFLTAQGQRVIFSSSRSHIRSKVMLHIKTSLFFLHKSSDSSSKTINIEEDERIPSLVCRLNTSRSRWWVESNGNGRRILDAAKPELETGRKSFPQ